jgi:hypothetical protein
VKNKAILLCSYILLPMVLAFPGNVHSQELSIPLDHRTQQLFEQLQDIEFLQRDIAECYHAQNKTFMSASLARQSVGEVAELDNKLVDRVFSRLAGAPEYEKFVVAYKAVIQRPDYNKLYATELYDEYMRLLDSERTRLTAELKEKATGSRRNLCLIGGTGFQPVAWRLSPPLLKGDSGGF